jgi:hypothetical protein
VTTRRPPRRLIVAWALLLLPLLGNIGLAFVRLAPSAPIAHVAMAIVVLAVFMELDRGVSLFCAFAGAGFL